MFYNEVMGVEVKKGKRRSLIEWIMLPFIVIFVVCGLIMTFYGEAGNGILCVLFFGACYYGVESVWVVKVQASSGAVKLLFPRPVLEPLLSDFVSELPNWLKSNVEPELGPKVAEILIRRKGQSYSHKNHDIKFFCVHTDEGHNRPFFQIDGDSIHVLDYDYDDNQVIKDSARLDQLVRAERVNYSWNQVIIEDICHRQLEVVLHFDTGDTTTHYISHHFSCGPTGDADPAGQLVKALEDYIINTK